MGNTGEKEPDRSDQESARTGRAEEIFAREKGEDSLNRKYRSLTLKGSLRAGTGKAGEKEKGRSKGKGKRTSEMCRTYRNNQIRKAHRRKAH